jgi:hypothetical protein
MELECRQCLSLEIDSFDAMHLSMAAGHPLRSKDAALNPEMSEGRLTVREHLSHLVDSCMQQGDPIDPEAPLLAVSCRNVLANPRCGAWNKGRTPRFLTVSEEDPERAQRPYHVLGLKGGQVVIEELVPRRRALNSFEWMVSGVPVWWDGQRVFPRMLPEVADLSHVFRLPRGQHPLATQETISRWRRLRRIFWDLIASPREVTFAEMRRETRGLEREDDYLHNIIGVTPQGQLRVLVANGRLERLGQRLAASGARRALMVDNGGSSSVFWFRRGYRQRPIQLIAAPNYRPRGTVFLFVVRPCTGMSSTRDPADRLVGSTARQ